MPWSRRSRPRAGAEIDRKTGEIRIARVRAVVDEVEDEAIQIGLAAAQDREPSL